MSDIIRTGLGQLGLVMIILSCIFISGCMDNGADDEIEDEVDDVVEDEVSQTEEISRDMGSDIDKPSSKSPDSEKHETGRTNPPDSWWKPGISITWQWQLDGDLDDSYDVEMYDLDMFEATPEDVAKLHENGIRTVCYISVGTWEDWRPDSEDFPKFVLGKNYAGWPGEKWLDIRRIDLLAPIMEARFDHCGEKGFDGIEPDNIDAYTSDTGFPLSMEDQVKYNLWLAEQAHIRGLSIGLKNDPELVQDMLPHYDWALTEDCFDQGWCEDMLPFIQAGKPVFAAEYTNTDAVPEEFCPLAKEMGFSAILKNRELDAFMEACP